MSSRLLIEFFIKHFVVVRPCIVCEAESNVPQLPLTEAFPFRYVKMVFLFLFKLTDNKNIKCMYADDGKEGFSFRC